MNIAAATADGESKLALGLFDNRWGDPDRWGCGVVPSAELAPSWESEETVEAADEAEIELPEERLDAKIKNNQLIYVKYIKWVAWSQYNLFLSESAKTMTVQEFSWAKYKPE